ncbi:hypothetical protein ALC56_10449, partial [Trachymyrmex septentrionalis]
RVFMKTRPSVRFIRIRSPTKSRLSSLKQLSRGRSLCVDSDERRRTVSYMEDREKEEKSRTFDPGKGGGSRRREWGKKKWLRLPRLGAKGSGLRGPNRVE